MLGALDDDFEEQFVIPLTQQPPPPPPPRVIPPEIVEIPDEEEIEEEIINLDTEVTEDMAIEDIIIEEPAEDIDQVFEVVEENATPIGGLKGFYNYVANALRYPAQARRLGIEGKVYVSFIVERDGTLSNISILRGIGGGCDEEALRVIKSSPIKWRPGKQRGKPVRLKFRLPIKFKIGL